MKKLFQGAIAAVSIAALTFTAALIAGCHSAPTAANVGAVVTPLAVQTVAEDGTFAALSKYPQLKQPLEAAVVGITNATAGGTLNLGTSTITGTLDQLGFGGLATQPGAELLMDNLTPLLTQIDAQLGTNSVANNTNLVPYLNAIAGGMQKAIKIFNQ